MAAQIGAANQRKNRNLYTSIGNYNSNSSKYGPLGPAASTAIKTETQTAQHSSLVALNHSLGHQYSN